MLVSPRANSTDTCTSSCTKCSSQFHLPSAFSALLSLAGIRVRDLITGSAFAAAKTLTIVQIVGYQLHPQRDGAIKREEKKKKNSHHSDSVNSRSEQSFADDLYTRLPDISDTKPIGCSSSMSEYTRTTTTGWLCNLYCRFRWDRRTSMISPRSCRTQKPRRSSRDLRVCIQRL